MPEGPEVRVITDGLNAKFGGHTLTNVEVVGGRYLDAPTIPTLAEELTDLHYPLTNVRMHCKGKFLYWTMDEGGLPLQFFITLAMTGSFGQETKHSVLRFEFDNGNLFFNDPRHFGTFKLITSQITLPFKLASLGWDPLQNPNIPPHFIAGLRAKKANKTIAEVMLDQKWFCGCGNYLRSEALYRARIFPNLLVKELTHTQLTTLCRCLIEIMHEAYKAGGTTLATFSDINGHTGNYYQQLKVYGRNQDTYGRRVQKMTADDGRSVWYVPELQREEG